MAAQAVPKDPFVGLELGHYRILERVGSGGFGVVYRARDEHLDREVAIKVLRSGTLADDSARRQFRKEAQALSKLNHPNIATIHDFDTQQNVDFLVMEHIPGMTLSEKLPAGPMAESEARGLGIQLAEGLSAAHEHGVVHRDLKPGNLRLTSDGRLKILDFGLAILRQTVGENIDTETLDALTIAGTLAYMAPEQLLAERVDARTDISGAGVVLYEIATGRRPFAADETSHLISAILRRSPILPTILNPNLTPEFERIICKCLEKNPANRYQLANDLGADLRGLPYQNSARLRFRLFPKVWHDRGKIAIATGIALILLALVIAAAPGMSQRFKSWFGIPSVPSEKLVAVLPFAVVGGDTQSTAFSDGLTETVTAKLSQLTLDPSLQVVPAPDIRLRGVRTAAGAHKELGVTLALEGNLQRSGNLLRINVALIDTRKNLQIRAESLTLPASDPFAVQDEVVHAVVKMLDLGIISQERDMLKTHGTQVASAYDYYLQGRGYLQNYDKPENIANAIQLFNRALQFDPRYALAFAGRGEAHWKMYESNKELRWVENSQQDCERALSLSSDLPAAHICLGTIYKGTGRYEEASAEFESAIRAEPTNDEAYRELANTYGILGRFAEAEATYRRAIGVLPHYWAGYNWLGAFYYQRGQYGQAAEMFQQVTNLAPDNARGFYNLGAAYVSLGRYSDAISVLDRSIAIRGTASAFGNLGNAYFYLRQYDEAVRAYQQAISLNPGAAILWWNLGDGYHWAPGKRVQAAGAYERALSLAKEELKVNSKDTSSLGILAICHAMLGEKQPALEYLRQGLELAPTQPEMSFKAALVYNQFGNVTETLNFLERSLSQGLSITTVRDTPDFDQLRSNSRFQELLRAK